MRGGEKALEVLCERYPGRRALHAGPRPRHRSRRRSSGCRSTRRSSSSCRGVERLLPPLPAALPDRDRAVRPRRLRPGRQHQPLRGQVGRHAPGAPPPLLLPDADALRLGPVRRLFRPASGWAGRQRACMRPVMAGWRGGTATRPAASDRYVAISHYVAGRIRRYYNREATVVYPPVDTEFFHPDGRAPERLRAHRVGARALQAHRPRHRRLPAGRRAAEDRRRRPRARARSSARRTAPTSSFSAGCPTRTSATLYRRAAVVAAARRRGLRHRAARGAGVRTAGRRARPRRRARNRRRRRDRRARRRADARGVRRRRSRARVDRRSTPTAIRRHAERFGRARFGDEMAALDRRDLPRRGARW